MEICPWCEVGKLISVYDSVYWELPDGTRAIEIADTPSFYCHNCRAIFQSDDVVKEIEDQLYLIDTRKLSHSILYRDLMKVPRLLKKNYFDFTS